MKAKEVKHFLKLHYTEPARSAGEVSRVTKCWPERLFKASFCVWHSARSLQMGPSEA